MSKLSHQVEMTYPPNPENQNQPNSHRRLWLLILSRTSIALGVILIVGITAGAWWAWNFIHEELAPLVERNLSQLLGRPIEVGEVESFSLNSLRFGSLSIPATKTDADRLAAQAVKVEYDPWKLLLNRTLELNVTLVQPDVYVEQAKNGRWVSTQFNTQEGAGFIKTDLETIQVQNADVVLMPTTAPGRPKGAVVLDQVSGVARFLEQNQGISFTLAGLPTRGGSLKITGQTRPAVQQTTVEIQGQNLVAADVSRLVDLPIDLQAGRVDSDLTVQFEPNQQQPTLVGTASLDQVTAQIENIPNLFTNTEGRLQFQGEKIALKNITTRYGKIPVQISGAINPQKGYNLSGQVKPVSVNNVLNTLDVDLPVPTSGEVRANIQLKGAIKQPILTGTVTSTKPAEIDRIDFSKIGTRFRLTPKEIVFTDINATPTVGGQISGGGRIALGTQRKLNFDLQAENVPGEAIARTYGVSPPINIGDVSADAKVTGSVGNLQTVVQLQAPEAAYPGKAEVVITDAANVLLRDAAFKVAGGTVRATGKYTKGQFQADVDATGVQLNSFSEQLRGQLGADLRLSGTSFQLSDVQAQGQVRFSQGLSLVDQPLTAQIRWNGDQILVQKATAPGFNANGTIAVKTQGTKAPEIAGFNLDVQAQDYNLQDLGFNLPQNVALRGEADFTGQVTGTPDAPNAVGDLRLENLKVNNLAFDRVLTGNLEYRAGQKTQLQLAGKEDQIAFTLGPNNRPTSFSIQQDQAVATGRSQGERLLVDVQDFPLTVLKDIIPGNRLQNIGPVAGDLSGKLVVNLAESTVIGDIAIAQPRLNRIKADQFRGRISYQDGVASLRQGELQLGESRISLSGDLPAGGDRQVQFQISFDQAKIENVLQALSIFDLQDITAGFQPSDLAAAAAVQPTSVGLPETSLLTQLRRFSEIETLLQQAQTQQRQASPLPTLAQLDGTISGEIEVTGSLQSGINASFDLLGSDWQWGTYKIDEVVAQGSFANGVLTLVPLRIDLGEALLAFTGQVGEDQLSGQVRVASLPLELIKSFIPAELPVEASGELNALITLAGSLENPRAIGEAALVDGVVSNQPVEAAELSFSYNDARLNFDSDVLITGTEPVEITGSIPVDLPFAAVEPDSEQISLNVNVQDQGLALLNLFTDQVTWVEGQGQLNLAVEGTLDQPVVTGKAVVNDATFKAQALPEPLTNVTGIVQLQGDRLIVEGIQGQYNQGQLTAEGVLPIFPDPQADQLAAANPLTVSIEDLTLDYKELYQGGVSGNVVITGTALKPNIGGTIQLMDGRISIAQAAGANSPTPGTGASSQTEDKSPIEFTDLKLVLKDDVRIVRQPILNFQAAGDLTINGTLANPRPQGVIRLKRGQVNLFTTQFNLARGYEQTARFTSEGGLNPILDIRLVATVQEATGSRIPTSPLSGEISDVPITTFGNLQTVRIQARVEGPADELAENLELTSEPGRSESEIIALLGGSFVNTLGRGDPTLGLANLAGSAILSNFQGNINDIGQAIGIDELRIFPTIVTDSTTNVSVLGLATEAVFYITDNFSVSLSRVFAADEPFRYNLLYRLNEDVLVRGSTNFADESRVLVEYETRF